MNTAMRSPIAMSTVVLAVLCCGSPLLVRKWTDRSGNDEVEAELVRVGGDCVVRLNSDGTTIHVPIAQLSRGDHAFVDSERSMAAADVGGKAAGAERKKRDKESTTRAAEISRLKSGRPVTGNKSPRVEILDQVIDEYMTSIQCESGTIAIVDGPRLLYSRGYGWMDKAKQRPTPPNAVMRIASLTKCMIAALIKKAIRERRLDPNARVFPLLGIEPYNGKMADARMNQITVTHLLEHKGGFDPSQSLDPLVSCDRIERELQLDSPAKLVDVIRYMLAQPLQFGPGERVCYSNYGYAVLTKVIEKTYGKPYFDCLQQSIARPLGIDDISCRRRRDPPPPTEASYVRDVTRWTKQSVDEGEVTTSAISLCKFIRVHTYNGELHRTNEGGWTFFGSMDGTTSMMMQRTDGIACAVLFNSRREGHDKEDCDRLADVVYKAIDRMKRGSR